MRVACRMLVLTVFVLAPLAPAAVATAYAATAAAQTARCEAPATSSGSKRPVKASSFAPRGTARNHTYGAPIQQPILKHRPKPKPQLRSEPLPPA
jgi:hypothetical protein